MNKFNMMAQLHRDSFPNARMSLWPDRLLASFYEHVFCSNFSKVITIQNAGQVKGFVVAFNSLSRFFVGFFMCQPTSLKVRLLFICFYSMFSRILDVVKETSFSSLLLNKSLKTWKIYIIAVNEDARGSGVGSELLRAIERSLGPITSDIEVNVSSDVPRVLHFYEMNGYEIVDRQVDFSGREVITLSKEIT